jgi:hypothetical protein
VVTAAYLGLVEIGKRLLVARRIKSLRATLRTAQA